MSATAVGLVGGGCSHPERPARVSAAGVVTLDDRPLPGCDIYFYPANEPEGGTAPAELRGSSDERGEFAIRSASGPGVPPGTYKVGVMESLNAPRSPNAKPLPTKYADPGSSPLRADVPPEGVTTIRLTLSTK